MPMFLRILNFILCNSVSTAIILNSGAITLVTILVRNDVNAVLQGRRKVITYHTVIRIILLLDAVWIDQGMTHLVRLATNKHTCVPQTPKVALVLWCQQYKAITRIRDSGKYTLQTRLLHAVRKKRRTLPSVTSFASIRSLQIIVKQHFRQCLNFKQKTGSDTEFVAFRLWRHISARYCPKDDECIPPPYWMRRRTFICLQYMGRVIAPRLLWNTDVGLATRYSLRSIQENWTNCILTVTTTTNVILLPLCPIQNNDVQNVWRIFEYQVTHKSNIHEQTNFFALLYVCLSFYQRLWTKTSVKGNVSSQLRIRLQCSRQWTYVNWPTYHGSIQIATNWFLRVSCKTFNGLIP